MQTYKAEINVGGNILHTVYKDELTAAEVMILRKIHGADRVLNLCEGRMDKRAHLEERARLALIYGEPLIDEMFGAIYGPNKLPVELPGFKDPVEALDETKATAEAPKADKPAGTLSLKT